MSTNWPGGVDQGTYLETRRAARARWMKARGYTEARASRGTGPYGTWEMFWREVLAPGVVTRKVREHVRATMPALPRDHCDAFARDGRVVAIATEPYDVDDLTAFRAVWEAAAAAHGLDLYVSAEDSWHYPGRTVLYVLSIPEARL